MDKKVHFGEKLFSIDVAGQNSSRSTGCPFLIKIMQQGTTIDKKIMRQGILGKEAFYSSLETMTNVHF